MACGILARSKNGVAQVLDWLISPAYAQSAAPHGGMDLLTVGMVVPMFIFLYFVMLRPQAKRQKEHKAMLERIAKGDEVVTSGGLAGRVTAIGEAYVSLEIAESITVKVQKSAVTVVLPKGALKSL